MISRARIRATLAILFGVVLTLVFAWPSLALAASQPHFPVVPPLPSKTASAATWAGWARQQRALTQSGDWTGLLSTSRCTVQQVTIVPTTSNGSGRIPAGVVTDAVEVTGHCATGTTGTSATTDTTVTSDTAATPSACPDTLTNSTTQAATDGTVCVGYYELAWAGAGYYYTGSGTVTGHVELGNGYGDWPGGACKAGTAYANGSGTTLSPGDYTQYITYGGTIVYDTEITGTWWEYSGGTYSNWGTVCGTFY